MIKIGSLVMCNPNALGGLVPTIEGTKSIGIVTKHFRYDMYSSTILNQVYWFSIKKFYNFPDSSLRNLS